MNTIASNAHAWMLAGGVNPTAAPLNAISPNRTSPAAIAGCPMVGLAQEKAGAAAIHTS